MIIDMEMKYPIEVVCYDPDWLRQYEHEKARILAVIAPYILQIEHIGSTAVPGLVAKPVIDILIAVTSLKDDVRFLPPLESLGYEYVQKHEAVFPLRRYLHLIRDNKHIAHLHMVDENSDFFRDQLLFRDYLRAHPEAAAEYGRLKMALARIYRNDREAYTDKKSSFIQGILALARNQKKV